MTPTPHRLLLAAPRGFCAGVDRAIDIVEMALQVYGAPVYVRHEIVHNRHVVDGPAAARARSSSTSWRTCRAGAVVIFSAHGVSPAVRREAKERGLTRARRDLPAGDQGAPRGAALRASEGYTIVLIGHRDHVEVEGTLGEAPDAIVLVETRRGRRAARAAAIPTRVAYITQTTLSVDDVRAHRRGAQAPLPGDPRAGQGRHLLRDPEPAERGEGAGAPLPRRAGGRRARPAATRTGWSRSRAAHGAQAYLIESAEDIRRRVDRRRRRDHRRRLDARGRRAGAASSGCARSASIGSRSSGCVEERVMFPLPGELLAAARRARRGRRRRQRARGRARGRASSGSATTASADARSPRVWLVAAPADAGARRASRPPHADDGRAGREAAERLTPTRPRRSSW